MIAILYRGHPIGIAGTDHILGNCGMTCQANSQTGMTMLVQILAKESHLLGYTREAMHEQAGGLRRVPHEEERFRRWYDLWHAENYRLSAAHPRGAKRGSLLIYGAILLVCTRQITGRDEKLVDNLAAGKDKSLLE